MRYRATSWLTTIYTYTSQGQPFYTVEVLCNRDTTTALLENQNGQWKVLEQDIEIKEFAPDSYQPIQGRFSTYPEALEFVNALDVNSIDPFVS